MVKEYKTPKNVQKTAQIFKILVINCFDIDDILNLSKNIYITIF